MGRMSDGQFDATDVRRMLGRMAHQVLEANRGAAGLVVVGILTRGFPVAKRLAFAMTQIEGTTVPCGSLDITAHRDDAEVAVDYADKSEIPFAITGRTVILVDEVIQTGRTVRAALDALMRHGRPGEVKLAALIDRGGRELPIQPDFVGRNVEVGADEYVDVRISDGAGEDTVAIVKGAMPCTS